MSSRPLLATAPHELDANLIFGNPPGSDREGAHGLAPYFAFLSVIRQNGGSKRYSIDFRGLQVSGNLYYQESGIAELNHPDADELGTVIEPRISWEVIDENDEVGERSGNFHIAPRTPDMRTEEGKRISTPDDLVGVNVRAQGSNLEPGLYVSLFRAIVSELGISARYFEELHEYTNIQDLARYVRVDRDESGPVHAVNGILARIGNLLANDREGYRKHVADDSETPGFYHSATIGSKRAEELVEGHRFAKEVKHYLPRKPDAFDPDHPLYHPKIEVSFQASRNADASVSWSDLEALDRELDELLLNVLSWVGFPIEGDRDRGTGEPAIDGPYIPDQYFVVDVDDRPRTLTQDPTPTLQNRQESVVIKHLRDGLADSELSIVEQLVADGGQHAPQDLADESGFHLSTIYRAMNRIPELIDHEYGDVALKSPYIAEQLVEAVDRANDALATAVETGAQALAFAADEIESSSLVKWLRVHSVDVSTDESGELTFRVGDRDLGSKDELRAALRKGLLRWRNAGRDSNRFKRATVIASIGGQQVALSQALPSFKVGGERVRVSTG